MIRSETHEETKLRLDVISRAAAGMRFGYAQREHGGVSKVEDSSGSDWFRNAHGDSR